MSYGRGNVGGIGGGGLGGFAQVDLGVVGVFCGGGGKFMHEQQRSQSFITPLA